MAPPSSPQNVIVTIFNGTEVELSWDAPADDGGSPITLYVVYVGPTADGPWLEMAANSPEVTNAGFNIVPGSDFYLVEAWNADGTAGSVPIYAPVVVPPPPTEPTVFELTLPDVADVLATYPSLEWVPVDAVTTLADAANSLAWSCVLTPVETDDTAALAAVKAAAVHQVAAWVEAGDQADLAGYAGDVSVKLAGLEVSGQPAAVSPRALRALRAAGLLNPLGA